MECRRVTHKNMENHPVVYVSSFFKIIEGIIEDHGVYLFMGFLVLLFAFSFWVVFFWQRKHPPIYQVNPPVSRGAIIFSPPPIGMHYDPEATIADSLNPPPRPHQYKEPIDF